MTDQDLNREVFVRVMGQEIRPHRDTALVAIGQKHVVTTGPVFHLLLDDGTEEDLPMQPWTELRKPADSDDKNDRYFLRCGEHLAEKYPKVKAMVDGFTVSPPDFANDDTLVALVLRRLQSLGLLVTVVLRPNGQCGGAVKYQPVPDGAFEERQWHGSGLPKTVCLLALEGVTMLEEAKAREDRAKGGRA